MSSARPIGRWALIGVGVLLVAVLIAGVGIVGAGEWQFRRAVISTQVSPITISQDAKNLDKDAKPVLILLHGAGLSGRMWDAVRRHLDARYRVIALDLPGHGVRHDEQFTVAATATVIAAAAQSVAPAPVILVGDSLGGYSAMAGASSIPKTQLRGLVVAGAATNFTKSDYFRYARDATIIGILSAFIDESEFISKRLHKFGVSDKDAQAMKLGGLSARAVPKAVRGLMHVDFREKLAAVEVPVLIVNGTLDVGKRMDEAEFLAAAKNSKLKLIENCDHGVSMRRSAEFADIVNGFAENVFGVLPPTSGAPST